MIFSLLAALFILVLILFCFVQWQVGRRRQARLEAELVELSSSLSEAHARLSKEEGRRQQLVQLEKAHQKKLRLLATVSHEIKTPLNGILGMSTLLADTVLTAQQRSYNDAIEKSGKALISLVNDLLDYSKMEAGKLNLMPRAIDLGDLVEECAALLALRAEDKGVLLATYIDPRLPETVELDPERLKQVLLNLLSNAIKFTNEGSIVIEALRETFCDGEGVKISVCDTGIGIDEAAQEHIFSEFGQADTEAARAVGGSGLGLTISRRIIEAFGGTLEVTSALGEGATFSLRVPLALKTETSHSPVLSACTVLLARKQQPTPDMLSKQIEEEGARLVYASDLAEIEAKLTVANMADEPFDLVLIAADLITDPLHDFDQLKQAAIKMPPCVVLIGLKQRGHVEKIEKAGFAAYLTTPVRRRSFQSVMSQLRSYAAEKENEHRPFIIDPVEERARRAETVVSSNRGLRVLLVEDNPVNALLSRALLERQGFVIEAVERGEQALAHIQSEQPFDMVLMDLHMPGLNGIQTTEKIRDSERKKGRKATSIIILTADASDQARKEAFNAGVDEVLTKPIDIEAFQAACDRLALL